MVHSSRSRLLLRAGQRKGLVVWTWYYWWGFSLDASSFNNLLILLLAVKEFSAKKQPARSTQIDINFLKWAIATLWECSGKGSGTKTDGSVIKPAAVVHIDANLLPEDIIDDLGLPMASKMKFLYTGETPMQHPDDTDLIAEILGELAPQLHIYLPVLYRLAILAILPVVPRSYYESEELEDVLAKPGDKREGQLLYQYDNIYLTCKKMISEYDLDAPPLFLFDGIDRRALVKLNKKIEVSLIIFSNCILISN